MAAEPEVLTDDEIIRLVRIGVERLGITTVRLTGGEPLLRRSLEQLVAVTQRLSLGPSGPDYQRDRAATRADALAAAGLDRINISLDTLDRDVRQAVRRRRLPDVLAGVEASSSRSDPVKINTVLLRGVNDHEAVDLLRLGDGRGRPVAVHRADAARRSAWLAARARW